MRIVRGRVCWYPGSANSPKLELLLDGIPRPEDMRYERRGTFYLAELDGLVSFFCWDGSQDSGYGGRHFTVTMVDGSTEVLKGPWSSRAGCMNGAGFTPCLDVAYTHENSVYDAGHTFMGGAVTLELVVRHLDVVDVGNGYGPDPTTPYVPFPTGSRLTLAAVRTATGSLNDELSSDQAEVLAASGGFVEVVHEPAVLFPDGTVWRKKPG